MNGETRDDQIRFAVTRDERTAWQIGLRKRNLNGSAMLRQFMDDRLDEWHAEDVEQKESA